MEERSKTLPTIVQGYISLFKDNPPAAVSITTIVAVAACAITYAYKDNILSFFGAKSKPPRKLGIEKIAAKDDLKIHQETENEVDVQVISDIKGKGVDIKQIAVKRERHTQGFPPGQSNH